jgi:gliding motility-associated-like protein
MVEVDVVNCGEPNIYVPNIFTPNNDGKNDKVYVSGEWIDRFSFEIFDRWGEKVFATNDIEEGWDGTFNGVNCDAAVYFYKLEVYCQGGKTYITGGDITLIR